MSKRIPSLNWLRVFEASARAGSFARAARFLNMSPPAVSQQIKALESHLGKVLFDRGPQSVDLTDAGRAFLPSVARALHEVETAASSLFGDQGHMPLVVQSSAMFATGWLAPRLPSFQATQPEIRLTLRTVIYDGDATGSDADLRIVFGLPPASHEDMDHLFGEQLTPVAPPEIASRINEPSDLVNFPLIEVAAHRVSWSAFIPSDGPPPAITYTNNTLTAFALARAGAIAIDRQPATGTLAADYGLVPCLSGLTSHGVQFYSLIYPARTALSRPACAFRDWLISEVEVKR